MLNRPDVIRPSARTLSPRIMIRGLYVTSIPFTKRRAIPHTTVGADLYSFPVWLGNFPDGSIGINSFEVRQQSQVKIVMAECGAVAKQD